MNSNLASQDNLVFSTLHSNWCTVEKLNFLDVDAMKNDSIAANITSLPLSITPVFITVYPQNHSWYTEIFCANMQAIFTQKCVHAVWIDFILVDWKAIIPALCITFWSRSTLVISDQVYEKIMQPLKKNCIYKLQFIQ